MKHRTSASIFNFLLLVTYVAGQNKEQWPLDIHGEGSPSFYRCLYVFFICTDYVGTWPDNKFNCYEYYRDCLSKSPTQDSNFILDEEVIPIDVSQEQFPTSEISPSDGNNEAIDENSNPPNDGNNDNNQNNNSNQENPDGGNPDGGNPNANDPDGSNNSNPGSPDPSNPDSNNPDPSNPDSSNPDLSNPDSSNPDPSNPGSSISDDGNQSQGNQDGGNPDGEAVGDSIEDNDGSGNNNSSGDNPGNQNNGNDSNDGSNDGNNNGNNDGDNNANSDGNNSSNNGNNNGTTDNNSNNNNDNDNGNNNANNNGGNNNPDNNGGNNNGGNNNGGNNNGGNNNANNNGGNNNIDNSNNNAGEDIPETDFVQDAGVRSCHQHLLNGALESGEYVINLRGQEVTVYCDMVTEGGGWTILQRRGDYGRGKNFFLRSWDDYKKGFGDPMEDFWLGLNNMHQLTKNDEVELLIELEDFENNRTSLLVNNFTIGSEANGFKISYKNYNSKIGNSLPARGTKFSTIDMDNDAWKENCAKRFSGAWWYSACHNSNLNGLYLEGKHESFGNGVNWYHWKGYHYSLKNTEMKVRPTRAAEVAPVSDSF